MVTTQQSELWRQVVRKENYLRMIHAQTQNYIQMAHRQADEQLPFKVISKQKATRPSDPNSLYDVKTRGKSQPIVVVRAKPGFESEVNQGSLQLWNEDDILSKASIDLQPHESDQETEGDETQPEVVEDNPENLDTKSKAPSEGMTVVSVKPPEPLRTLQE